MLNQTSLALAVSLPALVQGLRSDLDPASVAATTGFAGADCIREEAVLEPDDGLLGQAFGRNELALPRRGDHVVGRCHRH